MHAILMWKVGGLKASAKGIDSDQPAQSAPNFCFGQFSEGRKKSLLHDSVDCYTKWIFMDQ